MLIADVVFVFDRDLGDFTEADSHFLAASLEEDEEELIGGDAADASADEPLFRGGDDQDEVFFGLAGDDAEEAGELGFDEAAVEGVIAAFVGFGLGFAGRAFFLGSDHAKTGACGGRGDAAGADVAGGGAGGGTGCGLSGRRGAFGSGRSVAFALEGGRDQKDGRAEDGEESRQAADEGDGAVAIEGDFVSGQQVGEVEDAEDGEAEGRGGGTEEGGSAQRPLDAGGFSEDDGPLWFVGRDGVGGDIEERVGEDLESGVDLGVVHEGVEGILAEFAVRDAFRESARLEAEHDAEVVAFSDLACDGAAIHQLVVGSPHGRSEEASQGGQEPTVSESTHGWTLPEGRVSAKEEMRKAARVRRLSMLGAWGRAN